MMEWNGFLVRMELGDVLKGDVCEGQAPAQCFIEGVEDAEVAIKAMEDWHGEPFSRFDRVELRAGRVPKWMAEFLADFHQDDLMREAQRFWESVPW